MTRARAGFDVLVIGAGPAGLAAAARAGEQGARVGLVDDNPAPGGQIWRKDHVLQDRLEDARGGERGLRRAWIDRVRRAGVTLLPETTVVHAESPRRLFAEGPAGLLELRAEALVVATGARERFLPFPGWTLPGVTGAGGLQALVKGGLEVRGARVMVAGSGPLLLAVAAFLRGRGAEIVAVVEQARSRALMGFGAALLRRPSKLRAGRALARALRGVPYLRGAWPARAAGEGRLETVWIQRGRERAAHRCEHLACSFGLVPELGLARQLGASVGVGGDAPVVAVDTWQRASVPGLWCAGEITGVGGRELALLEGQIAGLCAAGAPTRARALRRRRDRERGFVDALARGFALRPELRALATDDTIVCRCEDVAMGALRGFDDARAAKLQTRCGMGPCQGRVCGPATAFLCGWTGDSIRPPLTPTRVGTLIEIGRPPRGAAGAACKESTRASTEM